MKLQGMTSSWPFAVYEIDIIGEIRPKASNGHRYIIVAIDYFSKWVKVESYVTIGSKQIARFIEKNIICRYGLPHHIVSDNGVQFKAETTALLKEYKIKHHRSSAYRPQPNSVMEAANKNVKRILSKMLENYRDWSEYLQFALRGYRTTARTSTSATPFSLVYGCEAVLPIEVEI